MKKFLAGSAIASIYTTDGDLIAISNTQINDTINLSVESQEVRSGYGNALDYIYYHSTRMEGQLEDAQFNLDYIKHNLGAREDSEASVYNSVTSGAIHSGDNTVAATGLVGQKVWAFYKDKAYTFDASYENGVITFDVSEQQATDIGSNKICIKYLAQESGTNIRNLTISANFIPDVVTIVLEAQLFASESGAADSSRIGRVLFRIPRAQLSGTQEISLSASGVASTPLSYLALKADADGADACSSAAGVYGYITEILEIADTNWYDGVKQLAIDAVIDRFEVTVGDYVHTYAITDNTAPFIVNPTNRVLYGTKTGDNDIVWINPHVTPGVSDKISAYGQVKSTMAVGDEIYVMVGDFVNVNEGTVEVPNWVLKPNNNIGADAATVTKVNPAE